MSKLSSIDENVVRGKRLVSIRESLHLTQTEFAEKLGLSPRAYQNYERGEREIPIQLVQSLHDVFKIDPLWVLSGTDEKPALAKDRNNVDVLLMEKILVLVEQHLTNRRAKLPADKKARLIRLIYEHCKDRHEGLANESFVRDMMALAT